MALTTKLFSDLITFTRASGAGRFNAAGQYEWLAPDQPRIDYDPVTGECRGLLIEEQRTNLLTYSSDFANAAWQKEYVSISSGVAQSPDGTANAAKMVENSANSTHQIRLTINPSATTAGVSVAVYVKADGRSRVRVFVYGTAVFTASGYAERGAYFDLSAGTVTSNDATTSSISAIGGGWYRISISQSVVAAGIFNFKVSLVSSSGATSYQGDGTSGIYIWGAQLEAGSSPSSYIPTTNAQVTRAADVASVNVLSPWFNASEGTLVVEYSGEVLSNSARVAAFGPVTPGAYLGIGANGGFNTGWYSSGLYGLPSGIAGQINKQAISYVPGALSGSINGSNPVTRQGSDFVGASSQMLIGQNNNASSRLNGHIRSIRYYPKRLSDSELQQLTG
uniref:Tail protein n=1 Tax=Pakpunavirus sp. TaxID=2833053 RepID=A0AB39BZ06_9CAUD